MWVIYEYLHPPHLKKKVSRIPFERNPRTCLFAVHLLSFKVFVISVRNYRCLLCIHLCLFQLSIPCPLSSFMTCKMYQEMGIPGRDVVIKDVTVEKKRLPWFLYSNETSYGSCGDIRGEVVSFKNLSFSSHLRKNFPYILPRLKQYFLYLQFVPSLHAYHLREPLP